MVNKKTITVQKKIPKLRFPGFSGEWEGKRLLDIFSKKQERNYDNKHNYVLTNSAIKGIMCQLDYFDKDIANHDNLTNYYVADIDDFIYNPRISKYAPVGPLKRNKLAKGIVSPLYTVLEPKKCDLDFFEKYFETAYWYKYMYKIANYGARHDRMNILQGDFMKMPVPYPSLSEQQKIADFLGAVDEWAEDLRKQKKELEAYKKGMMQKIFSQEIRFKDDNGNDFPEWEDRRLGSLGYFYRGHSYTAQNVKSSGLLVLRSINIQNEKLIIDNDLQFVDKGCNDKIILRKNDLAICMANGSRRLVGKTGRYQGDYHGKVTVGAFCSIFRSKLSLSQFLFQTIQYNKHLRMTLAGTNINNLKNSELENFKFDFPSSQSEQQKIADFLTSLDNLINSKQRQIAQAEEWKKGLMQKLFV